MLTTARLRLRRPDAADIPAFVEGAGDRAVAEQTLRIPHPYAAVDAAGFIARCAEQEAVGLLYARVIERLETPGAIGVVALAHVETHRRAELSYWLARPHWGQGFTTEAARAMMDWAFPALDLIKIDAHAFETNLASRRVLEKVGMQYEGTLRHHVIKWGEPKDIAMYGVLAGARKR